MKKIKKLIKKMEDISKITAIKWGLLTMCHADVEKAQKAYDFVMADSKEPANHATPSEMADGDTRAFIKKRADNLFNLLEGKL